VHGIFPYGIIGDENESTPFIGSFAFIAEHCFSYQALFPCISKINLAETTYGLLRDFEGKIRFDDQAKEYIMLNSPPVPYKYLMEKRAQRIQKGILERDN
jgi:hypothetical protein